MAQTWEAKAPGETKRYRWAPPIQDGDGSKTFSVSASGVTVDAYGEESDEVVFYISGGIAGTTGILTLSVLTTQGETLDETIYLPIVASTATGETAENIIKFALRPVTGMGGAEPDSDELADALEHLNDMLAEWGLSGADVGAALPLTLSSVVYTPPGWMGGIKNNLRVFVAEQYGRQVSPATVAKAQRGLQAIKFSRIAHAEPEYY